MIPVRENQKHQSETSGKILLLICYVTAEKKKKSFVIIPKSWAFYFFPFTIIITKSPQSYCTTLKKKKMPVSLMFFECHSKLKWKQDSVEKNVERRCQRLLLIV